MKKKSTLTILSTIVIVAALEVLDRGLRSIAMTFLPNLLNAVRSLKNLGKDKLTKIVREYDNNKVLSEVLQYIVKRLLELSKERITLF